MMKLFKDSLYYENSKGERVYFTRFPYMMLADTDLFDYEWKYNQTGSKGISAVYKEATQKTIKIVVSGKSFGNYKHNLDKMFAIFEFDTINNLSGNIVYNGYRLPCVITSKSNPSKFILNYPSTIELTVSTYSTGTWLKDIQKDFKWQNLNKGEYLDYPHDYDYDYSIHYGYLDYINIDTFLKAYPVVKIRGKALNPFVRISNKIYGVNTVIDEHDTLVIDSYNKKFYIVNDANNIKNVFSSRYSNDMLNGFVANAGNYQVYWEGDFNFSLDLVCERSEPSWI